MLNSMKPLFKASERLSAAQTASWYTRYAKEMKKLLVQAPFYEPNDQQLQEIASAVSSSIGKAQHFPITTTMKSVLRSNNVRRWAKNPQKNFTTVFAKT
uniref:ATP synthase subunit epsilon, mitochondrial n=1 Tax=Panagrellus redivivus TaxID=6233 RepID=A0A7E4WDM4_PANRE